MASSSSNRNEIEGSFINPKWFKTVIDPNQKYISICPKFRAIYERKIDYRTSAWIVNENKKKTMVYFVWKNDRPFLSNGIMVAKANGFNVPTEVTLFYKRDNKFLMFFKLPTLPVLPPLAPQRQIAAGWTHNPDSFFKTTIDPGKVRFDICRRFLNNFSSKLDFTKPAWLISLGKKKCMVNFKMFKGVWYMTDGITVSNQLDFNKSTTVYLYFRFEKNEFIVFDKVFHDIFKKLDPKAIPNYKTAITVCDDSEDDDDQDVIDMGNSDDDMADELDDEREDEDEDDDEAEYEDEDEEQYREFTVVVTESLAYSNQVFHFPNKTSKYILDPHQDKILLRDEDTRWLWSCAIKTSNRYIFERYLGEGWYDYKIEKELMPGDMLVCAIQDPPTHMNVKVVRAS